MTTNIFRDVRHFDLLGGRPDFKAERRTQICDLCERLIDEEVNEELLPELAMFRESGSLEHLAKLVDSAIDSIYVITSMLNQLSVDGEAHWQLVQDANMAKFPNGVCTKIDGKIQKPEGWIAPDHLPLLIEWNSKMRGETYVSGLIKHLEEKEKPNAR